MSGEFVERKDCEAKYGELMGAINRLNDRLYRDNGRRSIQSILNSHDTAIKFLSWICSMATVAILAATVKLIFFGGAGAFL